MTKQNNKEENMTQAEIFKENYTPELLHHILNRAIEGYNIKNIFYNNLNLSHTYISFKDDSKLAVNSDGCFNYKELFEKYYLEEVKNKKLKDFEKELDTVINSFNESVVHNSNKYNIKKLMTYGSCSSDLVFEDGTQLNGVNFKELTDAQIFKKELPVYFPTMQRLLALTVEENKLRREIDSIKHLLSDSNTVLEDKYNIVQQKVVNGTDEAIITFKDGSLVRYSSTKI